MMKIILLFALCLNVAMAKGRFSDEDRKKFIDEVKQGVAAHKVENKGNVDFEIIKPALYEELDIYHRQEKFTRDEMNKMKQRYEEFSKANSKMVGGDNREKAFLAFVEKELDEINKTEVAKLKEGEVCNNWSCQAGLKCAPDPIQEDVKDPKSGSICRKEGTECKDNKDCCSETCVLDPAKKKKYCDDVYRCFKPLKLGEACVTNPVCGEGECLPFNAHTSGIGECDEIGRACKKNSDCCSNSCENRKCVESYICKDCVKNGKKTDRGQKCCEGLYPNEKGICVPDVPPFVMPQVRKTMMEKIFIAAISLMVDVAHADEAYDTVNADQKKYSNFQAQSEAVDIKEVKSPDLNLVRKSDFSTCDIKFRDDFMNYMKKEGLLDLEIALLSFDFVMTGDGVDDYWRTSQDPKSSIYNRLKSVATKHQEQRRTTNTKIDQINHKLTCMCLDVIGYANIKDETKKTFFREKCEEYKVALTGSACYRQVACSEAVKASNQCVDGMMPESCVDGDQSCTCAQSAISVISNEGASGIKAKRLLTNWTKHLADFNQSLTVDNTSTYRSISQVAQWSAYEAKWNDAEHREYTLFSFHLKNPSGSVAAMGAILGALLAAGVIAVLGGFATTSMLTTWAAMGIILASAATVGTGTWLIASLKGAWISKRPEVFDKYIRTYGCGKKETCQEWSRRLNQPYNNICNVHTSANACIRNFVVLKNDLESRYIVDPWVPVGVPRNLLLRDAGDTRDYAQKLEDGFQVAKDHMISKNPGASGGGGKSGNYVSEDYMRQLFVDSTVLGKYTPQIGTDENKYILTSEIVEEIKRQAIHYAIREQFVQRAPSDGGDKNARYCTADNGIYYCSTDTENLEKFADYTYEYHFLWPKTSRRKEISYPTIGLTTYLDLMTNGVVANMAVGASKAANTFGNLNSQYLQDYLNNLKLYREQAIEAQDVKQRKILDSEIAKAQAELNQQKLTNALAANSNLDSQLQNLNGNLLATGAKDAGLDGDASINGNQTGFLKAIGTLRVARKEQLKRLDNYKRAIASNRSAEAAERANRVASASKKFSTQFAKPLSGSKGAGFFGSGGLDGLGQNGNNGKDKNGSNANNFGASYGAINLNNTYNGNTSANGNSGDANATNKAVTPPATVSGNPGNEEDSRRLAEAIEARDRSSKEKYNSNEDQTIFEKVTNAYIRNYDKVLIRKKSDKDVVEKK